MKGLHKVKPLPEASAGTIGLGFQWGHEMPLGRGVPQGARKPLLAVSKLRKVGLNEIVGGCPEGERILHRS